MYLVVHMNVGGICSLQPCFFLSLVLEAHYPAHFRFFLLTTYMIKLLSLFFNSFSFTWNWQWLAPLNWTFCFIHASHWELSLSLKGKYSLQLVLIFVWETSPWCFSKEDDQTQHRYFRTVWDAWQLKAIVCHTTVQWKITRCSGCGAVSS